MAAFDTKTLLFVVFLGLAFVLAFIAGLGTAGDIGSFILMGFALVLDVMAFSVRFYSYIYIPLMRMRDKKIVLSNSEPFFFSTSNNTIITRETDAFRASAFIKIPLYKSATEMSDQNKYDFADMFGKMVTLGKYPIMFASAMYIVNKEAYMENIRRRLNEAEEKYRELMNDDKAPKEQVERSNGEVTMWHNLADNVAKSQSSAMLTYAMVTAEGGTAEEAHTIVMQRAEEITAGIGTLTGISPIVMAGDDILALLEPEYAIPLTVVNEQIRERTVAEGI